MIQTKKWLIALSGFFLFLGVISVSKQDVLAAENFQAGSFITCTTDSSLYVGPDVNSGVVAPITKGSVATVVENDSIYTKVTSNGATGYLYDEFIGHDDAVIAAYQAQLEAQQKAEEQKALEQNAQIQELAAIIQCEAGSEPSEGQLAVGAVVMNRVKSPLYPNDIHSVIVQPGQFTPVGFGEFADVLASGNIKQSCRDAAIAAYQGADNTGGLLHFHRANGQSGLVIGNQVFF